LRRLGQHAARIVVTVLLGGFLGATLVRFAPGFGVDEAELDARRSAASVNAIRLANAEGQNILRFYLCYLNRIAHGDLGTSRTLDRPIAQLIAERIPETMASVGVGVLLAWTLGLGIALYLTMVRSTVLNTATSIIAGALLCLPAAVLALLFVLARAPARLAVGVIILPKVFRYARNLLARCASLPHVLTARAKGLGNARILCWHVLPNTAPQLLALAGVSVTMAFAACIPLEVICDMPGIGQLAWKAALGRDLYLLVNLTMIVTLITLVVNAAADLAAPRRTEA
jgi:peptide/nickel transport system permease protein